MFDYWEGGEGEGLGIWVIHQNGGICHVNRLCAMLNGPGRVYLGPEVSL